MGERKSDAEVAPVAAGDDAHATSSVDQLLPEVYEQLREAACRALARRAADHTLSPTTLVHEAYLKLARQSTVSWRNREHFMALSALAMRHVLVDRAKARVAEKRGGSARPVTLDDALVPDHQQPEALLDIHEALERLDAEEPRLARIIASRFFGGYSEQEIADALGVTVRTVQRDWAKARMLLQRALAR